MEYALFGIQLLKIACITIIAFILIATLVFIICVCVASGQASDREEKAIDEYLYKERKRRLQQANRELKEGCIKQSQAEEMERVYKEYYSKPLKIKKNKLRRKAINALKNINKEANHNGYVKLELGDVKEYIDGVNSLYKHPSYGSRLKAIAKYLRSEEKNNG